MRAGSEGEENGTRDNWGGSVICGGSALRQECQQQPEEYQGVKDAGKIGHCLRGHWDHGQG